MYKIMSLDVGTKRIGVALSDYLHILSNGLCCVQREPENNAINEIIKLIKENDVKLIIGVPVNMDGTKGGQAQDCLSFGNKLKSNISDCDIMFEDERLSSDVAEERLREQKIDFRKNKSLVDIESACVILEQYLRKL